MPKPPSPNDTPGVPRSAEFLATKRYIPRPHLVLRPRLTQRLRAALDYKLTLISAPPGFGKRTLSSQWIPQGERCVAWVSLDERDNAPVHFWAHFIAALQVLHSTIGELALAQYGSPQALPIPSVLTSLVNEDNTFPDVLALVLKEPHVHNDRKRRNLS